MISQSVYFEGGNTYEVLLLSALLSVLSIEISTAALVYSTSVAQLQQQPFYFGNDTNAAEASHLDLPKTFDPNV